VTRPADGPAIKLYHDDLMPFAERTAFFMGDLDKPIYGMNLIRVPIKKSKRTLISFVLMYYTSKHFLELARQSQESRFYNCMASMIFCAFSLEAYFNQIGENKLKHWKSIQRKLGPEEKLNLFNDIYKFPIDRGSRPFLSMKKIFEYRNRIAHPKNQVIVNEPKEKLKDGEIPKLLKTDWENQTSIDEAELFFTDTEAMIKQLEKFITGSDKNPFLIHYKGEWWSSSIDLRNLSSKSEHE